jgi:hypothetical protein
MAALRSLLVLAAIAAGSAQALAEPAADAACAHKGRGFVQVPGTMTCVKVAGRALAEADAAGGGRGSRMRAGGTVSMDVRSDTALGPVRGFVRIRVREGGERER